MIDPDYSVKWRVNPGTGFPTPPGTMGIERSNGGVVTSLTVADPDKPYPKAVFQQ